MHDVSSIDTGHVGTRFQIGSNDDDYFAICPRGGDAGIGAVIFRTGHLLLLG